MIIIVKLYFLSKKEKYNIGIQIIVLCIFLVTFLFHAPFEYLNRCEDSCYSASQRYDYMLTMTTVISDEGDMCDVPFDGRYLYIPILNKLIILDNEGKLKIKDVEHKKGDKYYYIDGNKYLKSDSWEVIS